MSETTNNEGTATEGTGSVSLLRAYDTLCDARDSLSSVEYILYRMVAADEAEIEDRDKYRFVGINDLVRKNLGRVESAIALIREARGV